MTAWPVAVATLVELVVDPGAAVAAVVVALSLFLAVTASFALARIPFRGRGKILLLILSVSMFPQITLVGPLYIVASSLGLLDTYTALILVYIALVLPLVTWVMYGYFETLPREIDEAARMDGLHVVGLYWHIILPMSLPSLVTTGLLAFITAWNEFLFALAFTSNIEHQTIPVGIANFTNLYYVPWGDIAAASAVASLPPAASALLRAPATGALCCGTKLREGPLSAPRTPSGTRAQTPIFKGQFGPFRIPPHSLRPPEPQESQNGFPLPHCPLAVE